MGNQDSGATPSRAVLKVADLMTPDVAWVNVDEGLDTVRSLMADLRIRHLPVLDEDGDLAGIISDRDLLRACSFFDAHTTAEQERQWLGSMRARDIMTEQVATALVDEDIRSAAQTLYELKIGCLPVTEADGVGRVVGILTESDFVRLFAAGE
ncbi:MAG: CBS domain-containing protein [Acidobacteria bacterium]|nr:MAG: CBS domain-containing protein [Acidobacteriota bacterium]REK08866.1 MAG: CBS domain-containing protein [Acidobacteriota bacterium]